MRKIKTLNINNSYRSVNLNTRLNYEDVQKVTKVTRLNEEQVFKDANEGKLEGRYILFHNEKGLGENDTLNAKLFEANVPISYFTNTVAPTHVMKALANNPRGEIVYNIQKEFTKEQLQNINRAVQLCRTAINCPIIFPDITSTQILFSLWDLRYLVDRVDFSFLPLKFDDLGDREKYYELNPRTGVFELQDAYKLRYYVDTHEILARWKIQLWLVCNTLEEMSKMTREGEKRSHEF